MRYRVEIEGDINEDFPHRVNSLREAVKLFREAVKRGDYDDYEYEKVSVTIKIWGPDYDEGGYFEDLIDYEDIEATLNGGKNNGI